MHELLSIPTWAGVAITLAAFCAMAVMPVKRCGALTSNGTPCRRAAYPGGTRCNLHGGATPQAKAAAQQTLDRLRLPAIEALHEVIETFLAARCDVCGNPNGDASAVIKACTAVLDRTGMPRGLSVTHSKADPAPEEWMQYLTDRELAEFDTKWQRLRALGESRMRGDLPDVVVLPVVKDGLLIGRKSEVDEG